MEHLPQAEYYLTADRGTALTATRDGRRRLVAAPDLHLVPSIRAHGYLTWPAWRRWSGPWRRRARRWVTIPWPWAGGETCWLT